MPISFSCPSCQNRITAPDQAAGRRATCPGCKGAVIVPAPRTGKRVSRKETVKDLLRLARDEDPPDEALDAEDEAKPDAQPPAVVPRTGLLAAGALLFVAGVVLLIAAFFTNLSLDARDTRLERIGASLYTVNVNLGGPTTYRESPKSDRTIVYFLAGLGAVSLALGVVCGAVASVLVPVKVVRMN
jgi:hypothetical protein